MHNIPISEAEPLQLWIPTPDLIRWLEGNVSGILCAPPSLDAAEAAEDVVWIRRRLDYLQVLRRTDVPVQYYAMYPTHLGSKP